MRSPPAPHQSSPGPESRPHHLYVVLGLSGTGAALLLLAAALWSRYGTAVFFDLVNAGLATCF